MASKRFMKKLESSKTTGGLYWNKFWELIAIRDRFKKENKEQPIFQNKTNSNDVMEKKKKFFQEKIQMINQKSVTEISSKEFIGREIPTIDPDDDFTSSRLDAIIAMHSKDYVRPIEEICSSMWGFLPSQMRKISMRELRKDVKSRPGFYKNPLEGFTHKLHQSARLWAEYHDLDWSSKLQTSFDKIWTNLLNDEGNLRFSCEPIEIVDKKQRLLAWKLEWKGPGQSPMSETDDGTLIKAFPAIAVLLLDNTIELIDGSCEHFMEIEELTTVKTKDLLEIHPFILHAVNSNMPYSGKESIHVPISPVLDIMSIALNVDIYHNLIEIVKQ